MDSTTLIGEIVRRLEFYTNREVTDETRSYGTPYESFTHPHMPGLNSLVIDALSVPACVSATNLLAETIGSPIWKNMKAVEREKTYNLALNWPQALHLARVIDSENNIYGLDLTTLSMKNVTMNKPHFKVQTAVERKEWNDEHDIDTNVVAHEIIAQFEGEGQSQHTTASLGKFIESPHIQFFPAGDIKTLAKAQKQHRALMGSRRRVPICRGRVFQMWPVASADPLRKRAVHSKCSIAKRRRMCVSDKCCSPASQKAPKLVQSLAEVLETYKKDVDKTSSAKDTIDLTQDANDSIMDSTVLTENLDQTLPEAMMGDYLPSEASFSRHLEDSPSTGQ